MAARRQCRLGTFLITVLAMFVLAMTFAVGAFAATGDVTVKSPAELSEHEVGKSVKVNVTAKYEGKLFTFTENHLYWRVTDPDGGTSYENTSYTSLFASSTVDVSFSFTPEHEGQYRIEMARSAQGELSENDFVADATLTIVVWKSIANAQVTGLSDMAYTGQPLVQGPTVTLDGKTLSPTTDYDVSVSDNVDVGQATVTVTGKGFYKKTATAKFNVTPADISRAVMGGVVDKTYTGTEIAQTPSVVLNGRALAAGTDYELSHENNTNAGTATVTATGTGNFGGSVSKTFSIGKASIREASGPSISNKTYTGSAITQTLSLRFGGKTLVEGEDYTATYSNNVNPGTATVAIAGKGNFKDSMVRTFSIFEPSGSLSSYGAKILSPANGATFATGSTITVKARSSIFKYEYYQGVELAGMPNYIYVKVTRDGEKVAYGWKAIYSAIDTIEASFEADTAGVYKIEVCWTTFTYTVEGTTLTFAPLAYEDFVPSDSREVYVGVSGSGTTTSISDATVTGISDKEYTGNSITQNPTVKLGGKTLSNATDYYITYKSQTYSSAVANNVDIGVVEMTIHGKGSYTGTLAKTFIITPKTITASMIALSPATLTYTGELQKPQVTVMNGTVRLKEGTDYTLVNDGGTEPGAYEVTVRGKGNYSPETATKSYTIDKWSIAQAYVTVDPSSYIYDGEAKEPAVAATLNGATLPPDVYTVSFAGNVDAGTAKATITAKPDSYYKDSASVKFTIEARDIKSEGTTVIPLGNVTYNRKAQTPVPEILRGETPLANGKDFTLAYERNTNVGVATVTITGKGNYKGALTTTFKISEKDIADLSVTVDPIPYQLFVEGRLCEPAVTVKDGTDVLTGDEVKIEYADNDKPGTAGVTIAGKGNYKGQIVGLTFEILDRSDYAVRSLEDKVAQVEVAGIDEYLAADKQAVRAALDAAKALLANETSITEELEDALAALTASVEQADKNLAADRAAKEAAREAAEAQAAAAREKATQDALANPSAAAVEKAILAQKTDKDPAGSTFAPLMLVGKKQTKSSNTLKWKKVAGASGYVVYGNKCGKSSKIKKLATVTGTSFKHKKLKKGTYYKYVVVAVKDTVAGQRVAAVSKMIHVATKGGKVGNHKGVTVKAKVGGKFKKVGKLTLKKGKSVKLKAVAAPASKKLKVGKHVNVRFESSDPKAATVSAKGVVKAKAKGACVMYAYAQNGVCIKIKLIVK